MKTTRKLGLSFALLGALLLGGCGGGGGGSTSAGTQPQTTNPTPNGNGGTGGTQGGSSNGSSGSTTGSTSTTAPTSVPAPSTTANQVPIVAGGLDIGTINRLLVSVTVCLPGTSTCQTIPNVVVDSGSFGLRLLASSLNSTMLQGMQPIASGSGTLNQCSMFAGGNLWGSVRRADVKLAGEVASNIPVQVVADGMSPEPSACANSGSSMASSGALGGNGLIGVGQLAQDCGPYCVSVTSNPYYYTCNNGACAATTVALNNQVVNPIAQFASDNNGVLITLPSVPPHGAASAAGAMTFGIDTQQNNKILNLGGLTAYNYDTVQISYKGTAYGGLFDTGSAMNYFTDSSIPPCSSYAMFCPANDLNLVASIGPRSIPFVVGNGSVLVSQNPPAGIIPALAGNVGDASISGMSGLFDFGLPFFMGRTVGFVITGAPTATNGAGPLVIF